MNPSGKTQAVLGRILIGIAAGIALYLACMGLGRTDLPGCRASSSCHRVMQSGWSAAFGIPVAFFGFVTYSVALLHSWAFARRERTVASLVGGMALSCVLAGAVWFTALQIFALESVCLWCCAATALSAGGAVLLQISRSAQPARELDCSKDLRDAGSPLSSDRLFHFTATGAALTAVGLLVLGSMSGPIYGTGRTESVQTEEVSPAPDAVENASGIRIAGHQLNPDRFPAFGSEAPEAVTALLLNDYACAQCRQYCAALENFVKTSPQPVRIVLLPAARDSRSEDLQRSLLTLFHTDRRAWRSVAALLTSGQISADPDAVGRAALQQAGLDNWAAAAIAHTAEVDRQIQLAAAIRQHTRESVGTDALPLLLCGSRILSGTEQDPEKLRSFLFPVPARAEAATERSTPAPRLRVLNGETILTSAVKGTPEEIDIRILNHGSAPLNIGWLALDQDCEVLRLPTRPVNPAETAVIRVKISPRGDGSFTRRLKIHSDAPGDPVIVTLTRPDASRVASSSP